MAPHVEMPYIINIPPEQRSVRGVETMEEDRLRGLNELCEMTTHELRAALRDWRRWRNRVHSAPEMRRRQERDTEARTYIEAIERELTRRTPAAIEQSLQQTKATLHTLATEPTVSLEAWRAARRDLIRLSRQR